MTLVVRIDGRPNLRLEHLVLDANGTLTDRGSPIAGVAHALRDLRRALDIHVATADTFGTGERTAAELGASFHRVESGEEKRSLVEGLGAAATAAVGNGTNDVAMLRTAALGIAVFGPGGTSAAALGAADVVATSIQSALDLLADPLLLRATLRP